MRVCVCGRLFGIPLQTARGAMATVVLFTLFASRFPSPSGTPPQRHVEPFRQDMRHPSTIVRRLNSISFRQKK